jgi:hypothetical protein
MFILTPMRQLFTSSGNHGIHLKYSCMSPLCGQKETLMGLKCIDHWCGEFLCSLKFIRIRIHEDLFKMQMWHKFSWCIRYHYETKIFTMVVICYFLCSSYSHYLKKKSRLMRSPCWLVSPPPNHFWMSLWNLVCISWHLTPSQQSAS